TFSDNKARFGGGLSLNSKVITTIDPSVDFTFVGNSASVSGGSLYVVNMGGEFDPLTITDVIFVSNSALDGGVIHAIGSFIEFDGCYFIGNKAFSFGGALSSASGKYYIYNSAFEGNSAGTGGALRLAGDTFIKNCSFVENTS
ncbi:unnamed protein product, partial [Laminaria digitata]